MGKAVRKCSIALIAGMAIGAMVFCGSSIGCHMLSGGRVYAAEKGTDSRGYAEKPEHYIAYPFGRLYGRARGEPLGN